MIGMKKNIIYIAIVLAFFLGVNFYFDLSEPKAIQKCPEDYPDTEAGLEEKRIATNAWITGFRNENPDGSISDFAKKRYQFYLENNCSVTLQTFYEMEANETETEEERIIRETIQEEMANSAIRNIMEESKKDRQNDESQQ